MPKIVPDIQNKIISIAEKHFKDYGFEKTDMREIAADAMVAVGTVYLHFQSKENLYLHVIAHSWEKVTNNIETVSNQDEKPEQLLQQVLLILVHEMTNRKSASGLWMEVGTMHHHNSFDHSENNDDSGPHDPIIKTISMIIKRMAAENLTVLSDLTYDQLSRLVFIMTVDLCMQNLGDISSSVDLIVDLVSSYLKKPGHRN